MLENNPGLEQDIIALCRTPQYIRLQRHITAAESEGGDGSDLVDVIVEEIRDRLLKF